MTDYERFQQAVAALSPDQIQRIKDKCSYEHMSWMGIWQNWPSLFEKEEDE